MTPIHSYSTSCANTTPEGTTWSASSPRSDHFCKCSRCRPFALLLCLTDAAVFCSVRFESCAAIYYLFICIFSIVWRFGMLTEKPQLWQGCSIQPDWSLMDFLQNFARAVFFGCHLSCNLCLPVWVLVLCLIQRPRHWVHHPETRESGWTVLDLCLDCSATFPCFCCVVLPLFTGSIKLVAAICCTLICDLVFCICCHFSFFCRDNFEKNVLLRNFTEIEYFVVHFFFSIQLWLVWLSGFLMGVMICGTDKTL